MKEPEDYFRTDEFKSLPKPQQLWLRIKIAFFLTLSSL